MIQDFFARMDLFGDSSVVFSVSVWIEDPWAARHLSSELHEAIWWALKDAGIVIAFPQLDVHMPVRPELPETA